MKTEIDNFLSKVGGKLKNLTNSEKFNNLLLHIKDLTFVTHNAKFINEKIDKDYSVCVDYTNHYRQFVLTENNKIHYDIMTSAAHITLSNLLVVKDSLTGKCFYELILEKNKEAMDVFHVYNSDFEAFYEELLNRVTNNKIDNVNKTNNKFMQVYYKVDDKDYNLLTVLPTSNLLFKCSQIINKTNSERFSKLNNKRIPSAIKRFVGGTQPQNFSLFSNNNESSINEKYKTSRINYALLSLPLDFNSEPFNFLNRNIFTDCFSKIMNENYNKYKNMFIMINKNYKDYNFYSKKSNINLFNSLIYEIIYLREDIMNSNDVGFTSSVKYSDLKIHQRIFLDNEFKEYRYRNNKEWICALADDFIAFFLSKFKYYNKKQSHLYITSENIMRLKNLFIEIVRKEK